MSRMQCSMCDTFPLYQCKCPSSNYFCSSHLQIHIANSNTNHKIQQIKHQISSSQLKILQKVKNGLKDSLINKFQKKQKQRDQKIKPLLEIVSKINKDFNIETRKMFQAETQKIREINQILKTGEIGGEKHKSLIRQNDKNFLIAAVQLYIGKKIQNGTIIHKLTGHSFEVKTVVFSPNAELLASGSDDKTISIWNVSSGQLLKKFQGHSSWVNSLAFSPNGYILASGSSDNTIRLWNISTQEQIRCLETHRQEVISLAFSPNGKYLVSGSTKEIKLWNLQSGNSKTFWGHTSNVSSVAFSPNVEIFASGSWDETIRIWSVENENFIRSLTYPTFKVNSIAFSPKREILASGTSGKIICLWNFESGILIKTIEGNSQQILTVVFSLRGEYLIGGFDGGTIGVWKVSTGEEVNNFENHSGDVNSVAFSKHGMLASGSSDKTICVLKLSF